MDNREQLYSVLCGGDGLFHLVPGGSMTRAVALALLRDLEGRQRDAMGVDPDSPSGEKGVGDG